MGAAVCTLLGCLGQSHVLWAWIFTPVGLQMNKLVRQGIRSEAMQYISGKQLPIAEILPERISGSSGWTPMIRKRFPVRA